jgi:hypothetical protein
MPARINRFIPDFKKQNGVRPATARSRHDAAPAISKFGSIGASRRRSRPARVRGMV